MSSSFNFSPLLCFVCRFCRYVFPDTEKLNEHKLEQHLGDCLAIKCIIFEETCVDEDVIPRNIKLSLSNPKKSQNFLNPYVALTKLTSEEVDSYSKQSNLNLDIVACHTSTKIERENQVDKNVEEFFAPFKIGEEPTESASTKDSNLSFDFNDYYDHPSVNNQYVEPKYFTPGTDISVINQHEEEFAPLKQEFIQIHSTVKQEFSNPSNSDTNLKEEKKIENPNLKNRVTTVKESEPLISSIYYTVCSKQSSLEQHMRKHSNYRPFKCSQCSASYKDKHGLTYHLISHGLSTSYKCRFCGRFFVTKSSLVDHERIHTGERPFVCQVANCGMGFASQARLTEHVHGVHFEELGLPQFVCHLCGKSFGLKKQLNFHYRSIHKRDAPG